MKTICIGLSFVLLLVLVTPVSAQSLLSGHWEGVISREGKDWRVWIDIDVENDIPTGTVDVPDYGLYALKLDHIRLDGRNIHLERKESSGSVIFKGTLVEENLSGQFEGLGLTASFRLKRLLREPVGYIEEEVKFQNGAANLVGTLVKPENAGTFPAIVFTHGSGNQTRTEDFYRSRAFLFARNGIAALIYDRRAKGDSTGGGDQVSFENLADDAIAAVRFLKGRKDINPRQIGISGFSQGGYVSPLAAARSSDVAFVIVGSAPGITPDEQNDLNVENTLRSRKVTEDKISAVMELRRKLRDYQFSGKGDKNNLESKIGEFRNEDWFRNTLLPRDEIRVYSESEKRFLSFEPVTAWEKVKVPVLSVWGDDDLLVPATKSRDVFDKALKKAKNRDVTLRIFSNAGHGLSVVRKNNDDWDWPRLAPGYHDLMVQWLRQRVDDVRIESAVTEISDTKNCRETEHRQFDFWIGEWKIKQKILKADGRWFEGEAHTSVELVLDGCALIEEWSGEVLFFWEGMTKPEKINGLSVRAYDPKSRQWTINWMDTRGLKFGEHEGNFTGGKGEFFRTVKDPDGRESITRIAFSEITKRFVQWDLAVSTDRGKTWRTLWVMEMARR